MAPSPAAEPGVRCPGWLCWAGLVAFALRRARLGAQGQPGAVYPVLTHTICPGTQTLPAARGASGAPETETAKVWDAVAPGALPGRGGRCVEQHLAALSPGGRKDLASRGEWKE